MNGNSLLNLADPLYGGYVYDMPPVRASNWTQQPPAVTLQFLEQAFKTGYISEHDYQRRKEELTGHQQRLEQYRMSVIGDPASSRFVNYKEEEHRQQDATAADLAVEEKRKCKKSKSK